VTVDDRRRRFDRQGILAIDPQAFLLWYTEPEARENEECEGVVVVDIDGPLAHRGDWWCDSYGAIRARFADALERATVGVVLRVSSPGGDTAGCFETARAMREMARASGKRVVSFVDGQACSAAYALACAAEEIVASESAIVGSIGVIATRIDVTKSDEQWGTSWSFVTSGRRKADGHPHLATSEAELSAAQGIVDDLAVLFFSLVAESRGMSADDVAALDAAVFVAKSAASKGLVDRVGTFDGLLAELSQPAGESTMGTKYEEARSALEEAAKGEGDEAEKAKKALAAMDGEDDKEGDDEGEGASSEGDSPSDDDDGKEDEPSSSSTSSVSTAAELGATVSRLSKSVRALEERNESLERQTFLASRPDLGKDLVKVLQTKPLAEVKAIVSAIPKPTAPAHAASASAVGTRGQGQGDAPAGAAPSGDSRIDEAFGVRPAVEAVAHSDHESVFNPVSPEVAREKLKALAGK
jgi:signal peptide peptidase SppA